MLAKPAAGLDARPPEGFTEVSAADTEERNEGEC